MTVRFDAALDHAVAFAKEHREALGPDIVIVRDILGRIRFALGTETAPDPALCIDLNERLGAFSPGPSQLFLFRSQLVDSAAVFEAAEARFIGPGIRLVERWVTGTDWLRPPVPRRPTSSGAPPPERITFFGIKGGVGRSTSLVATARHLAERGERVLVIDLDLESPGVTRSLLPEASLPSFGVVDWFVEDDAGQADALFLRDLIAASPLAAGTTGDIRVVPAGGTIGVESYVSKLARVYASPPGRGGDLATRLGSLIDSIEAETNPDWVLIDSRAGIHDLAAAAVTRLHADSLLFAVDTPQTWLAYRYLFATWKKDRDRVRQFRDGLRIVAAQVPETGRETYLERLRDHANDLFAEYLYDDAAPDDDEAFNFDVKDENAPHSPVPVYWGRELQDWDPTQEPATVTADQIRSAFGELFRFLDEDLVRDVAGA